MSDIAIKIENLSKQYRLGVIGTGTLSHDLNRWWKMNILGKEDPYLKIGETNQRDTKGTSDYVWALRDINLEVKQGEILGIIGKNGAGKSTLLKILSRVTKPSTGKITYKGRIASLLEVGTGFHPEMTGRENIFMNGTIMGMTRGEISRKLDEIVDFAGIERYIDTPVKRYSSGMTVRLGFAIAAHLEPEILVVDEVLAVGDAEFQKKAIGKMQDVSKGEGRTVLFVSHNMGAVKSLCNKGIILKNGNVFLNGNIETIVSNYLHSDSYSSYKFEWFEDYPRSENTILKGIHILDDSNRQIDQIQTNQNFKIQLTFEILDEQIGGGFTVMLSDVEEKIVFSSIANQSESYYGKTLQKGEYSASCFIPANFLNDEIFNISIFIFSNRYFNSKLLKNLLRIELLDSNDIRNDFAGKFGGSLRPKLKWNFEQINK